MHSHTLHTWRHDHNFLDEAAIETGQRRVFYVVVLTAAAMVAEIIAGTVFNSMALIADGWHMASHAVALGITLYAYWYARGRARDEKFTFGTGKVGVLGGFSSALVLGVVALLMVWESVDRFRNPLAIAFEQAMLVAFIGLAVNLLSVWLLHDGGWNHHNHHHARHEGEDHNLRAAYLHVLADILTSVLAIVALFCGMFMGWSWMDPIMGIIGAIVISKWSYGLIKDTGWILLDRSVDAECIERIRQDVEADADNLVADLHIWRVGSKRMAAILSVVTHTPRPPNYYKELISDRYELAHVTVEVHGCPGESCLPREC